MNFGVQVGFSVCLEDLSHQQNKTKQNTLHFSSPFRLERKFAISQSDVSPRFAKAQENQ